MAVENSDSGRRIPRLLVIGLTGVIVVLGFALVIQTIGRAGETGYEEPVNALANSHDECVVCHAETSPGIVEQFGVSSMAAAQVVCRDCHEVEPGDPGAVEHEGVYILSAPTPRMCEECHSVEVAQFNQSRHSLPAYVAYAGAADLPEDMLALYESIPEAQFNESRERNSLYALEGQAITRFACEVCHNIGLPQLDGSVGECTKCHLRHEFSLEQVRRPETCNQCHIGPDHPQYEIYVESPHGIAYATTGDSWNWEAEPGTLTTSDFLAPTCATCHMSGFGAAETTHDVGDRLTWFLFAPISQRRPEWTENLVHMQTVCSECHNPNFIEAFYADADDATEAVNAWVEESDDIMSPLKTQNLLTDEPFDEPIDFVYFELWHHWGRTAKFGAWMGGPDYTQWHGAYEVLSDLAELRQLVAERLAQGLEE
jgi:hypothetical protein